MNRPIEFRVWDKKCKQMWESEKLTINICNGKLGYLEYQQSCSCSFSSCGVHLDQERYIVMQFTGLLDKNGIKIFEGDIVSVKGHTSEDTFIAQVTEKRGGFLLDRDYLGNWKEYMLEIVGNLYESPTLLEAK